MLLLLVVFSVALCYRDLPIGDIARDLFAEEKERVEYEFGDGESGSGETTEGPVTTSTITTTTSSPTTTRPPQQVPDIGESKFS